MAEFLASSSSGVQRTGEAAYSFQASLSREAYHALCPELEGSCLSGPVKAVSDAKRSLRARRKGLLSRFCGGLSLRSSFEAFLVHVKTSKTCFQLRAKSNEQRPSDRGEGPYPAIASALLLSQLSDLGWTPTP